MTEKTKFNKRYDIHQTFEYNKEHGPFEDVSDKNPQIHEIMGEYGIETDFFGYKTKLPLGVAAGPLYNNNYMKSAGLDGFSVITWKTFRSEHRLAHRNDGEYLGHNIVYIKPEPIAEDEILTSRTGSLEEPQDPHNFSITNSYGMPSEVPSSWQKDITEIEQWMADHGKQAITSVVGSPKEGGSIEDLAADYASVARSAEDAGARIIEINLSCPNVAGKEGSIYKDRSNTALISKIVRDGFGKSDTKLLIKVGFGDKEFYKGLLTDAHEYIDGVVAINTIPMAITDADGKQALPGGSNSGVCGTAILPLATEAVRNLRQARDEMGLGMSIKVIGCGGVMSPDGFMAHIEAGAEYVMCATAALFNPELPLEVAKYIAQNEIKKTI